MPQIAVTPPPEPRSEYHYKRRHIDAGRVINETISALEGLAIGLRLVDVEAIPDDAREEWGRQLATALRPLNHFARQVAGGVPVVCARCGQSYLASRSDSRYCSGACRVAAHRATRVLPPTVEDGAS